MSARRAPAAAPRRGLPVQPLGAALVLVVLWWLAERALEPLLAPSSWSVRCLVLAAAVLVASALARTVRPRWVLRAGTAGLLAGIAVLVAIEPDRSLLGAWVSDPVGRARSVASLMEASTSPMVVPGEVALGIELLVLVLSVLAALLSAAGADRVAGSGLVPALALLAPGLVIGERPAGWVLVAAAACLVLLVVLSAPRAPARYVPVRLLGAAAALGLAVVLAGVLPTLPERTASGAASMPSVSITLRHDLVQGEDVTVFSYRGLAAGTPARFALGVIRDLDGSTWGPLTSTAAGTSVTDLSPVDGVGALTPGAAVRAAGLSTGGLSSSASTVELRIAALSSARLLTLQSSALVADSGSGRFSAGDYTWIDGTSTAIGADAVPTDADYLVTGWSAVADSTGTASPAVPVAAASPSEAVLAPYTSVPSSIAAEVSPLAAEVTTGQSTDAGRAAALAAWFHGNGFVYDESAPGSFDGSSGGGPAETIATFLQDRSGYCVHYAATFTVMARSLGLPTRIVIGYVSTPTSQDQWTAVSGQTLHAWPEVWLDGQGWVAFEPTPGGPGSDQGAGATSTAATATAATDTASGTTSGTASTASAGASSGSQASASAAAAGGETASAEPTPRATSDSSSGAGASGASSGSSGFVVVIALVGPLLLVLLAPTLARLGQRRARMGRVRSGDGPAAAAWSEAVATAEDLGLRDGRAGPSALTSGELARHLGEDLPPEGASALAALARWADEEHYAADPPRRGPEERSAIAEALTTAVGAMRAASGSRTGLRAGVLPRSLRRRRSGSSG